MEGDIRSYSSESRGYQKLFEEIRGYLRLSKGIRGYLRLFERAEDIRELRGYQRSLGEIRGYLRLFEGVKRRERSRKKLSQSLFHHAWSRGSRAQFLALLDVEKAIRCL